MKKARICLCCLMLVLIFATLLVSCGKDVEFNITFVVDEEDYATVGTAGEESIKMPEDPTKEGYTFDGWYWDNDVWEKPFTANSLMDTPLSSDMKVYAKWSKIHLHTEGDWITDTEATCAVAGAKHKECTECGEVLETVTIEKPAHTPSTWIVDDEATCAVVGEKHKECTACGETLETETIEKTTQHTEVIDAAVSETDTTDGLTEGKHCSVCGTVLVAQQIIPAHLQGTAIKSAAMTVTGETAYLSLPNNTTAFSFLNDITVANGATYIVARDISCENEINSKTVMPELEDNTYYILVTNGNAQKLYTVTLRRRPMYTVAFNTDGGTAVASQTIEEGAFISAPADPEKTGYTFDGWSRDLALAVTSNLTINANWEANPYTVTYDPNDGTVTSSTASVTFDHSYTLEEPTRTGYTFDGWYYGDDKVELTGSWTIAEDVTLVAEWTAIKYKITWKNWDGSLLGTTMVAYDSMPSYSGTPQREMDAQYYYVFAGWSPLLISVTGEATYTAQFTQYESVEYTIKYNLNGGSGSFATQIKQKGQPLTLHTGTPTRTSYVFVGWNNIYENTIYSAGGTLELDANVTLWAMWQKVTYCSDCNHTGKITTYSTCAFCNRGSKCGSCGSRDGVTIINGLGEVCSSCYSANRVTCSVCKGDYRTSYTNDCTDCSGRGYNYDLGTAPTVASIYARIIVLNALDGYEYSMDGITWQSSPIFENLKPHTSYTFYQRLATNGNTPFGVTSKAATFTTTNDTTYYVTYELNGGSNHQENPAAYETAGSAIALYSPTREHYTFAGWTYNGNAVESISPSWNDDITLVANWTPIAYTITYELDGGGASNPTAHGVESEAITLVAPTKKGYTFVGWTGSNGDMPQLSVTIPAGSTGNLSYTAIWAPTVYTVTYELNGGIITEGVNPSTYTCKDQTISFVVEPTKEHYIFDGWTYNGNAVTSISPAWCDNVTLVANWKAKEYAITYELSGGSADNPTTHGIESAEITLVAPTKAGYTFVGWIGSNGDVPQLSVTIPAGSTVNLSYTANWAPNTYTVTYELNGGILVDSNPESYTVENAVDLNTPTKKNYEFLGWYSGNTKVTTLVGACENLVLVAKWKSIFVVSGNTIAGLSQYGKENYIELDIPSVIDEMAITTIGNSAFKGYSSLTIITIPDSVTSIGSSAFSECSSLVAVIFGENSSLTSIGSSAFYYCDNLTSIIIPNSVTSISSGAFYGCTGIKDITVLEGNTKYHSDGNCLIETESNTLILGCQNSTIPYGVTNIGDDAFYGCTGLTSITIPDSVTSIGNYAFCGCTNLASVTIGNGVTSIGPQAFYYCSGLKSIMIPDNVTSIGSSAFRGCTELTSVIIGNGVTSIGFYVFRECTSLTNVTIGNGVKSIGSATFYGCIGLTSITIPDSVTSIGSSAFEGCNGLIEEENGVSYVDKWVIDCDTSVTNASLRTNTIGISTYAFRGCTKLTSITIPDSIINIGDSAFSGCTNIQTANIPTTVLSAIPKDNLKVIVITGGSSIGDEAFEHYSNLTSITISDSVTNIGDDAFYGCTGLKSVTIGNGVTSIGDDAFESCTRLTSVHITDLAAWCKISFSNSYSNPLYHAKKLYLNNTLVTALEIPEGITVIGNFTFNGCTSITSITIPDSVKNIGDEAFGGCTSIRSATMPINAISFIPKNNLVTVVITSGTSIASSVFYECTRLTSITISDSVTDIGPSAFRDCSSLMNVTFGENSSLTSIGSSAFYNCNRLESITIPDSVTSIGDHAFHGCTGIKDITVLQGNEKYHSDGNCLIETESNTLILGCQNSTIPYGVKSIGSSAFYGCTRLTNITIPDSVTSIGNYAFCGCTNLASVTIGNGVTSIGDSAFHGCKKLANVTIGNGVKSIGSATFYGCIGLTSITIPDSVTSIGSSAFEGCTGLTSITIPDSVTSIGGAAFSNCTSLTIYCEAARMQSGWDSWWNISNCPVVWKHKETN